MTFNWIDILLVLLVLLAVCGGWYRGFILGLFDLVRWIASLLAGFYLYQPVAELCERLTGLTDVWSLPAAFLLPVIATSLILYAVGSAVFRRLPRDIHRRLVNRLLGTLPGFINGLITAAIVSALLFAMPLSDSLSKQADESHLANRLAEYTETIETNLVPIFDRAIKQIVNHRIPVEPESEEAVELSFKVENPRPRPDLEAQMLDLVNHERATAGLAPVAADPELTEVARGHSTDMFVRGYFSHYAPEKLSPFDRMSRSGVRFINAGENIALAPTLNIAHDGLMNSPGHRANILNAKFGRLGIGIVDGGRRGLMVTQDFRN